MDKGKGQAAQGYVRKPRGRGRARGLVINEPSAEPHAPVEAHEFSQPLWTPPTFTDPRLGDSSEETQPPESQEVRTSPSQQEPGSSRASAQPEAAGDDEWVVDEDGRRFIEPWGNSFKKATVVCRALYKIVNDHWTGPFTNLTDTPGDVRKIWWSEFERKYYWDPANERKVKKNFHKKISGHMRNVINKAKTSKTKPLCIDSSVWERILELWETPAHKAASERARLNRRSSSQESGTGTYAGGSITIGEHKRKMAKELGTEPHFMALYDKVYTKKDNSYVSNRAKAQKDKFVELGAATDGSGGDGSSQGEGTTPSEAEVARRWYEASTAVNPKGRVYGWGSLAKEFAELSGTSSHGSGTSRSRRAIQEAQTAAEVEQLKKSLATKDSEIAELRQEVTEAKQEMSQTREEMNRSMAAVLAQMNVLMAERAARGVPGTSSTPSVPPQQPDEGDQHREDDATT